MKKIVEGLNWLVKNLTYIKIILIELISVIGFVATYKYSWYFTNFLSITLFLGATFILIAKLKKAVFINENYTIYLMEESKDEDNSSSDNHGSSDPKGQ